MRLATLAPALLVASCAYSTESLYDPDIRSVAVDVFGNDTFRRDLELQLTGDVVRQVRLRTPWRISTRSGADAVLTGRILRVDENVLSRDNTDAVFESSVAVTAEVVLTDLRTQQVLRRAVKTSAVPFVVPRGESLTTALDRSITDLAEDLVQALEQWK